jgi:RNase adaptor protein for sRNA GlmZ degradation
LLSEQCEDLIVESAPETALVLLKAEPEVIARRMKESPRASSPLKEEDIGLVLQRFEEEYKKSRLPNKFTLDTSTAAVSETLAEFKRGIEPFLTELDHLRMKYHQSKRRQV